jgi:single-strand DNA-binding protein
MFNGATVTLSGYVATEPYYRTTSNKGAPLTSMRVAWTSRFIDRETGEWRDGNTSFIDVNCWRQLAGNVAQSLRKGQPVVLTGRLQVREYEDGDGKRRSRVSIEADSIGHDLYRGVTHFSRLGRSPGEAVAAGLAAGEAIRAGLTDERAGLTNEDAADADVPALSSNGRGPGDGAGTSDDLFNAGPVSELAGAADGATAAVPF